MDSDSAGERCPQDSDYDGAWKEAFRLHLPEFLALYFPGVHATMDWSRPLEWCDKELSQVVGRARRRNQPVDVLVQVRLLSGAEQWILMHLEIQSSPERGFERRIARYNSGLFWTHNQRVVTLVVLADLNEDWRPSEDVFCVADFESRLRFPTCKLLDRLETDWRNDYSLPVQVARAQIEALRTAGDPEGRYRAKWRLVRKLYELGYNAEELRQVFRLIDWMMHLSEPVSQRFDRELLELEESLNMPYVTSVERTAEARGKALGKALGAANVLLKQLAKVCGPLPEDVADRIRNSPLELSERLGEDLLEFRSLADLQDWLDRTEVADSP
jgi:hypothetical protein